MAVMGDGYVQSGVGARLASVLTGASRGVEVGAENDSSAQRNTDGVDPDLEGRAVREQQSMWWSSPRRVLRRKDWCRMQPRGRENR